MNSLKESVGSRVTPWLVVGILGGLVANSVGAILGIGLYEWGRSRK